MEHLLETLKGYDKDKTYIVAKHSMKSFNLAVGRKLLGEIPDSTDSQDGTMQVWELPQASKPKVETKPAVSVAPTGATTKPKPKPKDSKPKSSLGRRIANKLTGKN